MCVLLLRTVCQRCGCTHGARSVNHSRYSTHACTLSGQQGAQDPFLYYARKREHAEIVLASFPSLVEQVLGLENGEDAYVEIWHPEQEAWRTHPIRAAVLLDRAARLSSTVSAGASASFRPEPKSLWKLFTPLALALARRPKHPPHPPIHLRPPRRPHREIHPLPPIPISPFLHLTTSPTGVCTKFSGDACSSAGGGHTATRGVYGRGGEERDQVFGCE